MELLSQIINDKDIRIRLAAIWALGNIGKSEVLPLLKPLLKEKKLASETQRIIHRIEKK
jgi:HEAT repeat protein